MNVFALASVSWDTLELPLQPQLKSFWYKLMLTEYAAYFWSPGIIFVSICFIPIFLHRRYHLAQAIAAVHVFCRTIDSRWRYKTKLDVLTPISWVGQNAQCLHTYARICCGVRPRETLGRELRAEKEYTLCSVKRICNNRLVGSQARDCMHLDRSGRDGERKTQQDRSVARTQRGNIVIENSSVRFSNPRGIPEITRFPCAITLQPSTDVTARLSPTKRIARTKMSIYFVYRYVCIYVRCISIRGLYEASFLLVSNLSG